MTTTAPATTGELAHRIDRLKLELHDAAVAFVARVAEAAPAADNLARVECELRAAENQAGLHDGRPPVREIAAEVVTGLLHGLSPFLRPLTTPESGQRAAEELLTR